MKKFLALSVFFFLNHIWGQELNLPVATQYLADNDFVVSPSFAGIGDNVRIRANGMAQWIGIKDAPNNQALYADFRIADQSGIGVNIYKDKNGNTNQLGARFSFAHHLILDYYSKQYLSFGISYNFNAFRLDIDGLNPLNPDKAITDDRYTSNNNFEVGLLYRYDKFYFSFNASNIIKKDITEFKGIEPSLLQNYQVYSGYRLKLDTNNELEPSVYYQYFASDKRSSTDLNLKYRIYDMYDDYYWAGISYRFLNDQFLKPLTVGPMVGLKKRGFYFGYSYQVTLNNIANYNSGTHMITLGFDFLQGISNCPCTQSPVHD